MIHKSGCRKKVLLAQNEIGCKAFHAHLSQVPKHKVHIQKEIWENTYGKIFPWTS
jgi:hypothetical protein